MVFELDEQIKAQLGGSSVTFDTLMQLEGERFRHLEGRTTARVLIAGKPYFIKQHRGVGYREIIKNVLQGRLPILGARHEYLALNRLASLGVLAPRVFGFGERGRNPAYLESFILMESLENTVSLETLCATQTLTPAFKHTLIKTVAKIMRTLHTHGINHRDCYLCHFLLPISDINSVNPRLYLIDLHRAGMRFVTPTRWAQKDLAGLYFSSKEVGLTQRDYYRFMKYYSDHPLSDILSTEEDFWKQCQSLGEALYREHH